MERNVWCRGGLGDTITFERIDDETIKVEMTMVDDRTVEWTMSDEDFEDMVKTMRDE